MFIRIINNNMEMEKENNSDNNKKEFDVPNTLIMIVSVLVILSGVQVFQTQKLLGAVSSGAVQVSEQAQGNSIGLPSQVGGCG